MKAPTPKDHRICTLDKHLDCSACNIASQVNCTRHRPRQMRAYYAQLAGMVVPSLLILLVASFYWSTWWLLPAYLVYWLIYQIVAELFIRCRHCPFWDESNPKLDCRINCGVPKLNRFKPKRLIRFAPGPMRVWEKLLVQSFSFLVFILPFGVALAVERSLLAELGLQLPAVLLALLILVQCITGIAFYRYLTHKLCADCLHFSCPNNRQPFSVIEAYLAKNETMREAWKEHLETYRKRR